MRTLALVVVAALVAAGCIGKEGPIEEAAVDDDDPPTPPEPTPDPTPSPAREEDPPHVHDETLEQPDASEPIVEPLRVEGLLAGAACVPAGPGTCLSPPARTSGDTSWTKLPTDTTLLHATLTASWEPSSPLTEELRFLIVRARSCGDGCTEGDLVGESVAGPSPLALDLALPAPAEGEWFEAIVRQVGRTPDPVYGWANLDQPFLLEGALTSAPPPTH